MVVLTVQVLDCHRYVCDTQNEKFTTMSNPEQSQPWLNTLTGTRIRIKTPGAETDNRVTIIEYIEPPNSSPPVFTRHEFVEVFCVQSGELVFQFLDEPRFTLFAGQSITCPSWKPHSFWNETDEPVSVLLVCSPAGLDQFFVESNKLLMGKQQESETGTDMPSRESAMKALRTRFGLEHVGTPPKI